MTVRRGLAVLVLVLAAVAAPADAGRGEIGVVANAEVCGGLTLIRGSHHLSCVHPSPDQPHDARTAAPPVAAAPVCYGDGVTGPRVQLIYGYLAGQRNSAAAVSQVRTQMAPRMQAMVKAASGGKDLGIRFAFAPGCKGLSVPVVRFPASVVAGSQGSAAEVQFGRMIETLQEAGFDRSDRKYVVIWDWWNGAGVCGLGELRPTLDQPMPVNVHNGVPTAGGHTDVLSTLGLGATASVPRYAAVWRHAFRAGGPGCWEEGQSRVSVQVHELFHTLGAVQLSAPHSDGGGHCTDTPSAMCQVRGKVPAVRACATQPVQVLDCGMDDFWHPAPPAGSYLEYGPNIAASAYFGPQPQDQLVFSPL